MNVFYALQILEYFKEDKIIKHVWNKDYVCRLIAYGLFKKYISDSSDVSNNTRLPYIIEILEILFFNEM